MKVVTQAEHLQKLFFTVLSMFYLQLFFLLLTLSPQRLPLQFHCRAVIPPQKTKMLVMPQALFGALYLPCPHQHSAPYFWTLLLRLPKALEPTLVGTKLFLPTAPDLLRKSARRWVTQVAVLQALFCAVTLLFRRKRKS